jgi:hypothetical protein
MNTVEGRPQFVDAVSQVVAIRPPQFVPFRLQPGEIDVALGVRFRRQPGEPFDNRNRAILLQVVNESCLRHATTSVFVNLRTFVNPGRLGARAPHIDLAGLREPEEDTVAERSNGIRPARQLPAFPPGRKTFCAEVHP